MQRWFVSFYFTFVYSHRQKGRMIKQHFPHKYYVNGLQKYWAKELVRHVAWLFRLHSTNGGKEVENPTKISAKGINKIGLLGEVYNFIHKMRIPSIYLRIFIDRFIQTPISQSWNLFDCILRLLFTVRSFISTMCHGKSVEVKWTVHYSRTSIHESENEMSNANLEKWCIHRTLEQNPTPK